MTPALWRAHPRGSVRRLGRAAHRTWCVVPRFPRATIEAVGTVASPIMCGLIRRSRAAASPLWVELVVANHEHRRRRSVVAEASSA